MEDEETRTKINAQVMDYEYLRGEAFSNKMAIQNLESMSPRRCFIFILFQQVYTISI